MDIKTNIAKNKVEVSVRITRHLRKLLKNLKKSKDIKCEINQIVKDLDDEISVIVDSFIVIGEDIIELETNNEPDERDEPVEASPDILSEIIGMLNIPWDDYECNNLCAQLGLIRDKVKELCGPKNSQYPANLLEILKLVLLLPDIELRDSLEKLKWIIEKDKDFEPSFGQMRVVT